jgi:hypothetical protein
MLDGVRVFLLFVLDDCWVTVVVFFRVKNLSKVSWYSVVGNVGVLYGIVHGAGKAILMRGGACAAELRLMGLGDKSRCAMGCVFVL